jgi:two-component system, NtrC family, sensor kinase
MRTLSARILLGFIALTISFGVFVATIVANLREFEAQASLVLHGYVPLALTAGDLAQRQDELNSYLDQGILEARSGDVVKRLQAFRDKRDEALREIVKRFEGLPAMVTKDGEAAAAMERLLPQTKTKIDNLTQAVRESEQLYTKVIAALPFRIPNRSDPGFQAVQDALDGPTRSAYDALQLLRIGEHKVGTRADDLRQFARGRTNTTKEWLTQNENTILWRVIYLGIAAMVLGVVITGWVAVNLQPLRRLREGARRIAAGDYGKRVSETGPTEIADLARELNLLGRAVEEREEEKLRAARLAMVGKMAAQIAHEVRNPLSSISLNTELLDDELASDAKEARELCRAIHTEVNRLTEVTERYLGLRGGKPKLARESLNAIIDDLVGFVRMDLAKRRVAVETDLAAEDPSGYIDANQIRQCLINLVRNAADAVSAKGGGRVVLRTRAVDGRVEIAVEDDGIGIANDVLPRLFDPFFSTKEGGNGLGLALTQQIIRDHGGEIHVASRVGRGTTFTLSVPIA